VLQRSASFLGRNSIQSVRAERLFFFCCKFKQLIAFTVFCGSNRAPNGAFGRFFRKGNQHDPFIDKEDIL
jgi:hypothetical protein